MRELEARKRAIEWLTQRNKTKQEEGEVQIPFPILAIRVPQHDVSSPI